MQSMGKKMVSILFLFFLLNKAKAVGAPAQSSVTQP